MKVALCGPAVGGAVEERKGEGVRKRDDMKYIEIWSVIFLNTSSKSSNGEESTRLEHKTLHMPILHDLYGLS